MSLAEFHSGAAAVPAPSRAAAPQAMKFAPARTHEQFQARNPSRIDICKENLEFTRLTMSRVNLLYLRSVQVRLCLAVLPTPVLTILLGTNRLYKPHGIQENTDDATRQ